MVSSFVVDALRHSGHWPHKLSRLYHVCTKYHLYNSVKVKMSYNSMCFSLWFIYISMEKYLSCAFHWFMDSWCVVSQDLRHSHKLPVHETMLRAPIEDNSLTDWLRNRTARWRNSRTNKSIAIETQTNMYETRNDLGFNWSFYGLFALIEWVSGCEWVGMSEWVNLVMLYNKNKQIELSKRQE